ncbi:MAG: NRDE family protein [Bryobacteraceae bacterium]|nr:NRDE family protein [Bryobacteraceae bacterium]
MCTVSWLHCDGGYELFCNRDEKRTRGPAGAPERRESGGVRYLAPVDRDYGGTWIGANEHGLTLCLLNGAMDDAAPAKRGALSRGLFLRNLLTAVTALEAEERFWASNLEPFAPFTIAALEPEQPAAVLEWNGERRSILTYAEPYMPLSSSSLDGTGVREARREELARRVEAAGKLDGDVLAAFHASHDAGPGAYSTCMHRPEAETISFSRVRVTWGSVDFFYAPAAPCKSIRPVRRFLPLRQS